MNIKMSIPSLRFRPRSDKHASPILYGFISFGGFDAPKFSTQIRIEKNHRWHQKQQRFSGTSQEEQSNNDLLDSMKALVKSCFLHLTQQGIEPTANLIRNNFLNLWRKKQQEPLTILSLFQKYYEYVNDEMNFERKTLKKYITAKEHFAAYLLKNYKRKDVDITECDYRMLNNFFKHLTTKNIQPLTAKRYCLYFVASCNYAIDNYLIQNNPFGLFKKKVPQPKPNKIIVLEHEQLEIYRLENLTKTERHIADLTTIVFYTGFDYVDLLEFDKSKHIYEGCIKKRRYKERKKEEPETVEIPINNILEEILSRYEILPRYSDKHIRNIYQNLLSRIGFVNFKAITFKQLRKSAGCYYLNHGVNLKVVSAKILGHSSTAITERIYVKIYENTIKNYTEHLMNRE